ncbi:DUF2339 domain-containing protein [Flavobacterium sp.]|uniref:DUF2339 domain-containing protein n=1 Tax=Flavobacterium sp. TaxID=239 RepID=UPI003752D245
MEFLIFILIVCVFILFNNFYTLKKENNLIKSIFERNSEENSAIKREIAELKKSISGKTIEIETSDDSIEEIKPSQPEIIPEIIIEDSGLSFTPIEEIVKPTETINVEEIIIETPIIKEPIISYESSSTPRIEKTTIIEEKVPVESAFSKFLKIAEKQFADNWTGILGTAIMVLGIGYLSIYAALNVAPLFRVLILWLYAGLLIGSYYILQKKEKWTKTGLWLRSAGASLFLFGCFGASQIPALAFISNIILGYSLIGLGIGLNLYIGYIIKQQTFLSLHVVLSLLILCVIPEKMLITFLLAAITSTVGIILSYKEKWEYHLLIVIIAFLIFDIWFNVQGTSLSKSQNIFAILGIILVSASCMYMQYRSVYENTRFDKAAFITHLTNWCLFAIGLILHSTGSKFKTFVLFIAAIICFFLALKARNKKVFWLYHLDGMVSFILCALSIIMLNDWNVGFDIIACILYSLTICCLFVLHKEKETLLYKIFLVINHIVAIALVIFSLLMISNSLVASKITNSLATTIALSIIAISVPIYSAIKKEFLSIDSFFGEKNISLNGIASIVFSILVVVRSIDVFKYNSFVYVLFAVALIWAFLYKKFQNKTFDIGRVIFYILSIFIGILMINIQDKSYIDFTFSIGLLSVIILNWTLKYFYTNESFIKFVAIIGVNTLFLMLTRKYLSEYQILQLFSLFGIALLNHEFLWINFKRKTLHQDNQTLLYICYYFFIIIGSLLFLYRTFELSEIKIGLVCLAISAIEIYVLFAKRFKNTTNETIISWKNFNLLNSEFLIFNALVFGFSCLKIEFTYVFLTAIAVVSFFSFLKFEELKRFNNYSILLLIGSAILSIYVAVDNFHEKSKTLLYVTQITSVAISIGYSYLQFKTENGKRFISALPYFQNLWIVILLFIQVEVSYLPLLFMLLAIVNYWLINKEKIKVEIHFVPLVALLAVLVSVVYCFDKLNDFNTIDWILQLSAIGLGLALTIVLNKKEDNESLKSYYQIVLNVWLSLLMFSQLEHKWLPVYWSIIAIVNLYLYHKKISQEKNINIVYYFLANLHLAFLSFNYYESKFLAVYLLIFALLGIYIYLASKWLKDFKLKNSLLIYPATLSIGFFLYLTFDKGILTFFWVLEALALLILGIILKEKYFRYVSLSLVGICVIRLMFFDLSNADLLIRALVLLGVGVVLIIMNSLFKKYKDRFD